MNWTDKGIPLPPEAEKKRMGRENKKSKENSVTFFLLCWSLRGFQQPLGNYPVFVYHCHSTSLGIRKWIGAANISKISQVHTFSNGRLRINRRRSATRTVHDTAFQSKNRMMRWFHRGTEGDEVMWAPVFLLLSFISRTQLDKISGPWRLDATGFERIFNSISHFSCSPVHFCHYCDLMWW